MKEWMKKLQLHYERIRSLHPEDRLMILFDIDGTILDMRHMILSTLRSFDNRHGTHYFRDLKIGNIRVHETNIVALLDKLTIREKDTARVVDWYEQNFWSADAVMESHRPFVGVMEVIRWFQIQPKTFVGLNTGRPECIRADTLHSLNKIGQEFKVRFGNEFLYMNRNGWEGDIVTSKVAGILHFQKCGYRVFACVDNEPENLRAIADVDAQKQILLLHADTLFKSKRKRLPPHAVSGKRYDLAALIHEKALPKHVQFVWHGVNDEANLRQFLASGIQWAECDVRLDHVRDRVVLRDDSFESAPLQEEERLFTLEDILDPIQRTGKSVKLDLKENGVLIDRVLWVLRRHSFDGMNLWFNGRVDELKQEGFSKLTKAFPQSIIQVPIDCLVPLILSVPGEALALLDKFRSWGVNRFSMSWKSSNIHRVLDKLDKWGFEANIYNVPDLESFLQAVLLLPTSVTSDFNFPKWHYYGRGSGENQKRHSYEIVKTTQSLSL